MSATLNNKLTRLQLDNKEQTQKLRATISRLRRQLQVEKNATAAATAAANTAAGAANTAVNAAAASASGLAASASGLAASVADNARLRAALVAEKEKRRAELCETKKTLATAENKRRRTIQEKDEQIAILRAECEMHRAARDRTQIVDLASTDTLSK